MFFLSICFRKEKHENNTFINTSMKIQILYFFILSEIVGKYYVVFDGRKSSIYNTWDEVKLQVLNYCGAQHMMYKDQRENAFVEYWTVNDTKSQAKITKKNSMISSLRPITMQLIHIIIKGLFFDIFIRFS